jgi:hypothetical protein
VLETQRVLAARDGLLTDAEAASHRPGWRTADAQAEPDPPRRRRRRDTTEAVEVESSEADDAMSARDAYILETCDAWRSKDAYSGTPSVGTPTQAIETMPAGAYIRVGLGANEGDTVSWNGAPARLVRRSEWLFPEVINVGPTRAEPTNRGADSMTVDVAAAQKIRDAAYAEYVEEQVNVWRLAPKCQ